MSQRKRKISQASQKQGKKSQAFAINDDFEDFDCENQETNIVTEAISPRRTSIKKTDIKIKKGSSKVSQKSGERRTTHKKNISSIDNSVYFASLGFQSHESDSSEYLKTTEALIKEQKRKGQSKKLH